MDEKGFTLIEMLVVLLIISILLLLVIPNIGKQQASIQTKGCSALQKMVQSSVEAYRLDHEKLPESLQELKDEGYITTYKCKNNSDLTYEKNSGIVSIP
ncbi:competence type IV pilus major pilin ComGC [Gottfriedia solisilvae]|uniref:ComG operon protein 3 n=1 Tax=Gottfriedia solisilvae TaxID=1516104 RepID=A0A8J3AD14_9BACI|nr:competence type IV pilus major pilin ComGC [Gottfriedia solisilvae]GGI11220.1 competence protein ComG [Gottfriedia solisilvae]